MRIGIIAFLHESNTFSSQPTTLDSFRGDLLLTGPSIHSAMAYSHHEVGGFFEGLQLAGAEAIPLFAARALPAGTIVGRDFQTLMQMLLTSLDQAGPLDGILVAPHGATVSEEHRDADGYWLKALRDRVGASVPIIGTLDAHANLSEQMVLSCNALVAYRTNPHLDQRQRGLEAANLLVKTVQQQIKPTMAAAFPPMAISIDRQCTSEAHLIPLYEAADRQLENESVLSNSILLGFPYADVAEMGASVIVVTDDDPSLAHQMAAELAKRMWSMRHTLDGEFIGIEEAIANCQASRERVCLLDMGDNVGGGSSADGTELLAAIAASGLGPAFGCLLDPAAVLACEAAGPGASMRIGVGGKTDSLHGSPLELTLTVRSLHSGRFRESQPRHGGITEFDQGRTAVCETDKGLTLMLTSKRMVPFSLQQLRSCELDPRQFRVLVAKGVNAPIAAYREVCDVFIRVNTRGSTCADMKRLSFRQRRVPMYPFEEIADSEAGL